MRWRAAIAAVLICLLAGCAEFDYGRRRAPAGYAGSPPTVYTVRRGDTLYAIAWRYGLDFRRVARLNGIPSPYTIYPGQTLRLRGQPRHRAAARHSPASSQRNASTPSRSSAPSPTHERSSAPDPSRWRWPATGTVVRRFDADRPGRQGIGLNGSRGDPVRAAAAGRVVYSGNGLRGYGNLIIVKHSDRYLTAYGYNRKLLVSEGDRVKAGEVIARMSAPGSDRPSLHFEIRRDGKPVDPLRYLPAR